MGFFRRKTTEEREKEINARMVKSATQIKERRRIAEQKTKLMQQEKILSKLEEQTTFKGRVKGGARKTLNVLGKAGVSAAQSIREYEQQNKPKPVYKTITKKVKGKNKKVRVQVKPQSRGFTDTNLWQ